MNYCRFIIIASVLLAGWLLPVHSYADCQGCCFSHDGVVCRNGVTMCGDGTSLDKLFTQAVSSKFYLHKLGLQELKKPSS